MEGERKLRLLYGGGRPEMGVDRGAQRPGQVELVLAHRQQLLVLGIGQVAQFHQGGGNVRRGQDREAGLAVGPRQQVERVVSRGAPVSPALAGRMG